MKSSQLIYGSRGRILVLAFVAALAVSAAACRHKREVTPPYTYPVSGKLVSASGKIPAGYRVTFEPEDSERAASGLIAPDGAFTLETLYMGVKCPGAAEGEYTVTIIPPMSMANASVVVLPKKVKIEPRENKLTVPIP